MALGLFGMCCFFSIGFREFEGLGIQARRRREPNTAFDQCAFNHIENLTVTSNIMSLYCVCCVLSIVYLYIQLYVVIHVLPDWHR